MTGLGTGATTGPTWWVMRRPGLSVRVRPRDLAVVAGFALLAVAVLVVTLLTGSYDLSPAQVAAALVGAGPPDAQLIVETFRLPRALTALAVGAALGLSGALFQGLARNPLVAPDVIGVNSGASVAALAILIGDGPLVALPFAAFAGGLAAAGVAYLLAYRRGLSRYRMLIVGVAINALCGSAIGWLVVSASPAEIGSAYTWLVGSLAGADWRSAVVLAVALVVLGSAALTRGEALDVLAPGHDRAAALGLRMRRTQVGVVVVATGLAAVAVAFTGPVGFVGFLAPNLARRLIAGGAVHLVGAATLGATLTLLADLVAQRAFAPNQLPVGVLTVLLGAPYFLYLLGRRGRVR